MLRMRAAPSIEVRWRSSPASPVRIASTTKSLAVPSNSATKLNADSIATFTFVGQSGTSSQSSSI